MATGRVPTTANSPLTAKGDLFTYSTTQARLAVGNDGDTLLADSSTTTGLRYNPQNVSGPYYNLLTPMKKVQITATYNNVTCAVGNTCSATACYTCQLRPVA